MHAPAPLATSPTVSLSFATLGRVQFQVRALLGFPWEPASEQPVLFAWSHAGLPRPGRALERHPFVVTSPGPTHVLAAIHHDCAYYFIANLADKDVWEALSRAHGRDGLELILLAPGQAPSSIALSLDSASSRRFREQRLKHASVFAMTPCPDWSLRLGELTTSLPGEFERLLPEAAACKQHCVLACLSADGKTHLEGLGRALKLALP